MCHGGPSPTAGLALETYVQIYQSATDPYNGILIELVVLKVTHL